MRNLLLLPLFLVFIFPSQNPRGQAGSPPGVVDGPAQDGSSVAVLEFKWSRSRQAIQNLEAASAAPTPARAMIPANKTYQRNARVNDPVGARDPNEDTIDGRSAAIEKIVQESRRPNPKPVDGFAYTAKVHNASKKVIEILFWEYQFIDPTTPAAVTRRQFLCGVKIKPAKEKELQAFSLAGPSDVISVGSLANKAGNPFQEKVVVNRVEYADGTIWQRQDWSFAEIGASYKRLVAKPWGSEMCRGL
jgi:hypothetical protein